MSILSKITHTSHRGNAKRSGRALARALASAPMYSFCSPVIELLRAMT